MAPPVTIRNAIPVFSAPPRPPPHMGLAQPNQVPPQFRMPTMRTAPPPVTVRQAVPVFSAPKASIKPVTTAMPPIEEKVTKSPSLEETSSPAGSLQMVKEDEVKLQEKLIELEI